jgi:hypothetical protein
MDEALFLSGEAMGALMPTLAARSVTGDPQIMYASSAGVLGSDHLRGLRDRGRKGGDPSLVYVEHCAPGSLGSRAATWARSARTRSARRAAPSTTRRCGRSRTRRSGRRITVSYIRAERRALPPEEFGRERLGWFTEPAGAGGVPLEQWSDCADEASKPTGRPVFMVDVSPGSRSAAIVACMYRPDGFPHLEVVAHGPGTDWVTARCASS